MNAQIKRIGISCLLLFLLNIGQSVAQLSISATNTEIKNVLRQIETKSNYTFFYSDNFLDLSRKVSISIQNQPIETILNTLFRNTNIAYRINNTQIALSEKPAKEESSVIQPVKNTVSGTIRDGDGEPIIGATVVEKDNPSHGTVTDVDGNFSLPNTSENSILQISYVGMKSQEVALAGRTFLNLVLESDTELLDEVVVVGYGVQKKVNLTGAVSAISVNEIGKRQVSNTSIALQGLIPGMSVIQRGGGPNDAAGLRVRGYTTLGNVTPLILVDGIEMGIDNIDPSIIESISILKDAASAAIYGNRAAAGVVLITTKRANKEQINVSYNGFVGQQRALAYPKNVSAIDHMELLSEAQKNVGITPTFTEDYIKTYKENLGKDNDLYPNTDWYKELLTNSGLMQSHTLSISGGTKRVSVLGVVGYLEQKGIIENVEKKRRIDQK